MQNHDNVTSGIQQQSVEWTYRLELIDVNLGLGQTEINDSVFIRFKNALEFTEARRLPHGPRKAFDRPCITYY